jgi:hypothetical protein
MEAKLEGLDFEIKPITPEKQLLRDPEDTEWRWQIKAKNHGRKSLYLTLNRLVDVDGQERLQTIETFKREIVINVSWPQRIGRLFDTRWDQIDWFWTAMVLPAGAFLWRSLSGRRTRLRERQLAVRGSIILPGDQHNRHPPPKA